MRKLLEELKALDPETWENITQNVELTSWRHPRNQLLDHLLGTVMRVISSKIDPNVEKRKHTWGYSIEHDRDGIVAWVHSSDVEYPGYGETEAAALLTAYIEALKEGE